ncbi:MAG: precorrin-6y C5,15-methyltransferase (decarboxylating) subunit CbiE [Syntrophomonadaceae bacterium]|nr:precorrin-6y C5,15-methyltransferase (decarboxylating) subunit CbiE [Syntrophomonadaceae bacterium]
MIRVVGTGPGNKKYITPMALEIIGQAQVLVGGKRQLEAYALSHHETLEIGRDLNQVIDFITAKKDHKNVVVLASGDTGLFSIASILAGVFDESELEFIPGISSVQLMLARLKKPWHNINIFSVHGREAKNLEALVDTKRINCIVAGGYWTPQRIAQRLLARNFADAGIAIGQNLSYPDEKIIYSTLNQVINDQADYSNSLMVIFYG